MIRRLWKRVFVVGLVLALMVVVFQMVLADHEEIFGSPIAISPLKAGMTDDGVAYDPYDIVVRESYTYSDTAGVNAVDYSWYKLFDGEEFGLSAKHNIAAISIKADEPVGDTCGLECVDYILMSFSQDAVAVPGITGKVMGQDVVYFEPVVVSPTNHIDGSFGVAFDGSDVGLTTNGEKIEGLDYWTWEEANASAIDFPAECWEGILFINTLGAYRVPAAGGGSLVGNGSDVLMFCGTQLGSTTQGYWLRGHDEADYPLSKHNAMNGIDIAYVQFAPTDQVEEEAAFLFFYFTARTTFTGGGVAGGPGEVYGFPGCSELEPYFGPAADLNDVEPSLNGVAGGFDVPYYIDAGPVCN